MAYNVASSTSRAYYLINLGQSCRHSSGVEFKLLTAYIRYTMVIAIGQRLLWLEREIKRHGWFLARTIAIPKQTHQHHVDIAHSSPRY